MPPDTGAAIERSCPRFHPPSRNPRNPTCAILLLLGLTGWLGCDGLTGPDSVVEVQVTPAGTSISGVGATTTFSVVARNANGDTIPAPAVTWSSLNPHVATIDEHGTATAVASGQVTIVTEVDGQIGNALLTVSATGQAVTSWTVEFAPNVSLQAVWGTSSTDVYAVGQLGTILHYDGVAWSAMTSGTTADLAGVWGTSSGDVYAVGDYGIILRGTR